MHNLKTNFDKIYQIVKSSLSDKLDNRDNLQFYPRLPKMNDCSIIALSICQETLGIDQMMLKRNYAKTNNGLTTRLISKIAAVTILQYINYQQNKPINHLKHALAA